MTYYYDSEAGVMLAVDDASNVRIIKPVNEPSIIEASKIYDIPITVTKEAPKFSKGCPECGSISKHKSGCSRPPRPELARYPSGARKPMKRAPCNECQSKGNRHKRNCSNAGQSQSLTGNDEWAKLDEENPKRKNLMSQRQYDQVKTAHQHGMDPTSIAQEMNLTVKEANTAVLSKSYEHYSQ